MSSKVNIKARPEDVDWFELIGKLTAEARKEDVRKAAENTSVGYKGATALMPSDEDVPENELEEMSEMGTNVSLMYGNSLLYYPEIMQEAEKISRELLKEDLSRERNEFDRYSLRNMSSSRLRKIDQRYGLSQEDIDHISGIVVDYMEGFGFPNLGVPDRVYLEHKSEAGLEGRHNFQEDRVTILNEVAEGSTSRTIRPVWMHELGHRDNAENLVGYERAEKIREGSQRFDKIPSPLRQRFNSHLEKLPSVNRDLAKGLIYEDVFLDLSPSEAEEIHEGEYRVLDQKVENLFSSTGVCDFDYRDEAICHFFEAFANGFELEGDNLSGWLNFRSDYYDDLGKYSEKAGTKMANEVERWSEAFQNSSGSRGERVSFLMDPEHRNRYFRTGDIPVLDYSLNF